MLKLVLLFPESCESITKAVPGNLGTVGCQGERSGHRLARGPLPGKDNPADGTTWKAGLYVLYKYIHGNGSVPGPGQGVQRALKKMWPTRMKGVGCAMFGRYVQQWSRRKPVEMFLELSN